jgi:hypothetical protein
MGDFHQSSYDGNLQTFSSFSDLCVKMLITKADFHENFNDFMELFL